MKTMRLLLCLLPAIILAGCSSDDGGEMAERVAVHFSAGNIAGLQSRTTVGAAGGTQWTEGDPIGIFMLENGQTLSAAAIAEDADNVPYKAQTGDNAQSGFTPAASTVYYPQNGDKVDFIAYYPYKQTGTNPGEINGYTYPVDVSDQSKPEDIDVLYSDNATAKDKNSDKVDLLFKHALSKVSFILNSGAGLPNLTGAKIEISSLYRTADMALADGSLSNLGSRGTVAVNGSNYAIVIPQSLSGTKLIITLADNVSVFEWAFTTTEFKEGKNHPYNITVDKTGIIVTTGNITDWTGTGDQPTEGVGGIFYKVGDYYPDPKAVYVNGILVSGTPAQGVVFWVDPADSRHGKAVGLKETTGRWGASINEKDAGVIGIDSYTDGKTATRNLIAKRKDELNFSTYYFIFNWIYETMNGGNLDGVWYLPALDELSALQSVKEDVNIGLSAISGAAQLSDDVYWSSSENGHGIAWIVDFDNGGTGGGYKGSGGGRARCVLAF